MWPNPQFSPAIFIISCLFMRTGRLNWWQALLSKVNLLPYIQEFYKISGAIYLNMWAKNILKAALLFLR